MFMKQCENTALYYTVCAEGNNLYGREFDSKDKSISDKPMKYGGFALWFSVKDSRACLQ